LYRKILNSVEEKKVPIIHEMNVFMFIIINFDFNFTMPNYKQLQERKQQPINEFELKGKSNSDFIHEIQLIFSF